MNKKRNERISFRITDEMKDFLEKEASLKGLSLSALVEDIIKDYSQKDIIWESQVQGSIEYMRGQIEKLQRDLNLFSDLWLYWTEFYFTYTKSFGNMPNDEKKLLIAEGKLRSKKMVGSFKEGLKAKKPGLFEKIIAEYLIERVE